MGTDVVVAPDKGLSSLVATLENRCVIVSFLCGSFGVLFLGHCTSSVETDGEGIGFACMQGSSDFVPLEPEMSGVDKCFVSALGGGWSKVASESKSVIV